MNEKSDHILYFLNDWFENSDQKSVTFYRDNREGYIKGIIKNKWNKVVGKKKFRLIGEPEPVSQFWWGYTSPFGFTEAEASPGEVAAYFNRIRKRRTKRHRKSLPFYRIVPREVSVKQAKLAFNTLFGDENETA